MTQDWLDAYRRMLTIRLFEEQVNELYRSARMPGLAHLYIGEEAVAVGVCEALRRDDFITSTHRGHGHCLAKGASATTSAPPGPGASTPCDSRMRSASRTDERPTE